MVRRADGSKPRGCCRACRHLGRKPADRRGRTCITRREIEGLVGPFFRRGGLSRRLRRQQRTLTVQLTNERSAGCPHCVDSSGRANCVCGRFHASLRAGQRRRQLLPDRPRGEQGSGLRVLPALRVRPCDGDPSAAVSHCSCRRISHFRSACGCGAGGQRCRGQRRGGSGRFDCRADQRAASRFVRRARARVVSAFDCERCRRSGRVDRGAVGLRDGVVVARRSYGAGGRLARVVDARPSERAVVRRRDRRMGVVAIWVASRCAPGCRRAFGRIPVDRPQCGSGRRARARRDERVQSQCHLLQRGAPIEKRLCRRLFRSAVCQHENGGGR